MKLKIIFKFGENKMRLIIQEFPNYEIDEFGNVFNAKRNKKLKTQKYNGYLYVGLHKNGKVKLKTVHRLVAETFLQNPNGLPCVNHKDENKNNNSVENLEWCTYRYNNLYGENKPTIKAITARKKSVFQYDQDGNFIAKHESSFEAQRRTGIKQSNISKCCLGRKGFNTAGGFVWRHKYKIKRGKRNGI